MQFVSRVGVYGLVHPVAQVEWVSWTVHWSTVIGLAALGLAYLWGARHLAGRARRTGAEPPIPTRGQKIAFFSGLLVIFASLNGPRFYGLPINEETITLERAEVEVPPEMDDVVPFLAGERLRWKFAG